MATNITYYLIRHKPTGGYLPQPLGRMGRGGSHVEPVVHDVSNIKTEPRVFHTKRSASSALGQWLLGKHECHRSGGYLGRDNWVDYDEYTEVVHQPHRIREDMEIIPVDLVIP